MQPKSISRATMPRRYKRLGKSYRKELNQLQQQLFTEGVVSRKLLDAVPSPLLIINKQWQVIYANPAVRTLLGDNSGTPQPGLREGEAFHCVHVRNPVQDAGIHQSCQICGVAKALSRSLKGEAVSEDCRLTCDLSGLATPLDIRVWATPLEFHGEHFSILSLIDISDKRRRETLENICFHDLLNTLTCIKGFLSVMQDEKVEDHADICTLLERMTQASIDEITTLRLFGQARQDSLEAQLETLEVKDFLELMHKTLQSHPAAAGKLLLVADETHDRQVETDPHLLRRIVGNMAINALEATEAGGTVTMGCRQDDHGIRFWIHNQQFIPAERQSLIFQRNASNKGHGRGVGTFSIKLLTTILGGEARFVSSEAEGTTFSVSIPQ